VIKKATVFKKESIMIEKSKGAQMDGIDGAYQNALGAGVLDLKQGRREQHHIQTRMFFDQKPTKREILWLHDPALTAPIEVHAVVEDMLAALPNYMRQDYTLAIAPFTISVGKCAILQDASGTRICILERTRATRTPRAGADVLA
jgi:hypothetical protein